MVVAGFQNPMDDMLLDPTRLICCWKLGRRPDLIIALVGFGYRPERVSAQTTGPSSFSGGLDGCCLGGVPPLSLVIGSDSSPSRLIAAFFIDADQIWGEDVEPRRSWVGRQSLGEDGAPELGAPVVYLQLYT
ncbi:hypothetical protein ACLOJK_019726, partial [Asimina triloba]